MCLFIKAFFDASMVYFAPSKNLKRDSSRDGCEISLGVGFILNIDFACSLRQTEQHN
ncbi:hypothetical protein BsLM_2669 [Bacillus sp. LM 4-2]|nr:hypothetical protein BsLM_2669 [Bacillus sp. LM 4-2]NDK00426.1 hypothetical protein [Bacillus subtilis subsp. subtilis]